jgi:hypothetical protein
MFSWMFNWPKRICHVDAMQIFSFCMAYFSARFYPVFSMDYGAPEEIRTPDPQIRSLGVQASRKPESSCIRAT